MYAVELNGQITERMIKLIGNLINFVAYKVVGGGQCIIIRIMEMGSNENWFVLGLDFFIAPTCEQKRNLKRRSWPGIQ